MPESKRSDVRGRLRHLTRVSLRGLLLFVAAIAVWSAFGVQRARHNELDQTVLDMKEMLGEVIIDNIDQFAIASEPIYWSDERVWNVYVPEGGFALRYASQNVERMGFPSPTYSVPITPGTHRAQLTSRTNETSVLITIHVDADRIGPEIEFDARFSPGIGNPPMAGTRQQIASSPLELVRSVFHDAQGGTTGLLIWIEKDEQPRDGSSAE